MCIIVAKPAGAEIPNEKIFDNCFESNKDGIGISYALPDHKPTIAKGFANVKKLMRILKICNVTKEHNLVVHFRFATHGKKDQGNCHPFPLTSSFEEMRYLSCSCDTSIAHNGVFSGFDRNENHSDTMKFIGGILAQPEIIENLESKSIKELIKGYCGASSKLAFLRPKGLNLIGDFELDEGVYYSNRQYKRWNNGWQERVDGKSWCYKHKEYDHCTWCKEHKEHDLCEHKLSKNTTTLEWHDKIKEGNKWCQAHQLWDKCHEKILDLRNKCEWCPQTEGVIYSHFAEAKLCPECISMFVSYQ